MIDLIMHLFLLGVVIYFLAEALPGIHVRSFGTAIVVAVVYGLINITLGTLLKLLSIPFIIISVGIFLLFINAFLLWLTDQLIDDFEIDDIGTTFIAALIITVSDTALAWIF